MRLRNSEHDAISTPRRPQLMRSDVDGGGGPAENTRSNLHMQEFSSLLPASARVRRTQTGNQLTHIPALGRIGFVVIHSVRELKNPCVFVLRSEITLPNLYLWKRVSSVRSVTNAVRFTCEN